MYIESVKSYTYVITYTKSLKLRPPDTEFHNKEVVCKTPNVNDNFAVLPTVYQSEESLLISLISHYCGT